MIAAVEPSALYEGHRANYQGTKRPGKVPDGRAVAPRLVHEFPTDDVTGLGRRKIPATKQKPTKGSNVCIVYPRVVHRELVDTTPLSMHDGDVLLVGQRHTIFGAGQNRITRTMTWRHLNTELARPENMLDVARPETLDRVIAARSEWIADIRKRVYDDVETLAYLNNPRSPQNVDADFMENYTRSVASLDCAKDVLRIATRAQGLRAMGQPEPYEIDPWFDWRAVRVLTEWTVDGVLHNSEFAKEIINEVYPSSIDDEMLLNVAMQGPCHVRNSKHEKHAQFFDDAASPGDMLLMCIVASIVAPGVWMYQLKPASSRQLCDLMQDRGTLADNASCAPGGQEAHFSKFDLLLTVGAWKIGTVVDDRMVTGMHGKMNVAVSIEFLSVEQMWYMVGNEEIPILCLTRERHLQRLRDHARAIRDLAEMRRQIALEEALRRMVARRREEEARRRAEAIVRQQIEDAERGTALAAWAMLAEEAARKARELEQRRRENAEELEARRRADAEERRMRPAQPERPLPLPALNDWTAMVLYQRAPTESEQLEYNIGARLQAWEKQQARMGDYFGVGGTFNLKSFATDPWNRPFQNRLARIRGDLGIDTRPQLRGVGSRAAASPLTYSVATRSYVTFVARNGLAMTGLEQNMYANAIRMLEMTNMPILIENAVVQQLDPGTREGGCAAYAGLKDGGVTVALCTLLEQQGYQPVEGARLLRFKRPEIRLVGNEPTIVVDNINFQDLLEQRELGTNLYVQAERINAALVILFNVPHSNGRPWRSLDEGRTWQRAADDLIDVADIYDTMVDRAIDGFNSLSLINGLSRAFNHCIIAMAVLGSCNLNGVPDRLVNRLRLDVEGGPGSLIQWDGGRAPDRLMELDGRPMPPQYATLVANATSKYDTPFENLTASWDILSTPFPGEVEAVAPAELLALPAPAKLDEPYLPVMLPEFAFAGAMEASGRARVGLPNPLALWRFGLSPNPGISYPLPPSGQLLLPGNESTDDSMQVGMPVRASWTSYIYNSVAAYYPQGGYGSAVRGMINTLLVMAIATATPPDPDDGLGQFNRAILDVM